MTRKIKRTARQIGFSGGTAVFSLLFFFFALSCLLCAAPQAAVSILNGKRTGLLLLKLSLCIFSAFAVFSVRAAVKNGAVYFFLKKARGLEASVKDVFCFFQKDAFFLRLRSKRGCFRFKAFRRRSAFRRLLRRPCFCGIIFGM